jgi:RsiW-degrading membrane proteinase PrsW (M82 family)
MAAFVVAIVLSFVPAFFYSWILYWLDRYEREPLLLVAGVFIWGAIISTIGAIILGLIFEGTIFLLTGSEALVNISGSVIIAPLVEESLKGFAVLLVFWLFRHEFDSMLDGMVYGGIVGLGFAATENVLYLLSSYAEEGWSGLFLLFVLRVILGAWGHAVYTSFIGIGIAIARLNRNPLIKLLAPIVGWGIAVLAHALHNAMAVFLATSLGGIAALFLVDWTSWLVMFGIIVWAIAYERRWIRYYLREEVASGLITRQQYELAQSTWGQTGVRFRALLRGRRRITARFYQLCAELAQKKHQHALFGEERNNTATIGQLRSQIARLSPHVTAGS